MHTRDIVALIAVISVVVCVVDAKTQRDTGQFSFAIIVDSEPGQKLFADKLQSLLEAEAAVQWDGRLVERADMDKLLEELKISASGIADPNSSLKLSQILNFDCLLAVKTKTDSVIATVSLFPSTLVIYEKTYTERLEPHSLAVNIVTNAIRAVREHSRDADKPQVSIGSFYNVDPHRKFLDFSIDVSLKLRQELVKNRTIILTERLFPSDLLSEFELARGGFTEQIAKNLSAPPSDILLYGEFQTKSEQNLNEPFAELNFTLLVVSPTGMCENHKVEFSCRSNEQEVVIEQVLKIIRQAVSEVRTKLDAGKQRSFSQREFEEFKKQAFRLMPNPPMHDLYGRLQFGKREELERALHMLECAMLFKGDDVQILLSMGAVFDGMRRARQSNYSPSDKEFFTKICQELVERAYYIGSDKNTRYCYWYYFVYDGLGPPPPGCIQAAKYIWDTRKSEYWERDHIHFSLKRLLESDIDTQLKYKLFLEEVSEFENAHRGLLTLGELFRIFEKEIRIHDYNTQFMNESLTFAQHLLNKESIYIKALGHVLNFTVYFRICEQNKDTEALKECTKHFREAIDLLADLHEKYDGNVDLLPYSYMLLQFYDKYDQLIKKFGLENDSAELKEKYITIKLKAGDYGDDGIPQLFHTLLPQLWEQSKYERGCELLTDYLENLDLSNISIDIRSYFIGEYNRFLCAMQGRAQIGISIDRFEKIEFDDNLTGNVNKIVASENSIYGIRSQFVTHTSGRAFKFTPADKKANMLKQISSEVCDIACTGKYVGIATRSNGFYLFVDNNNMIRNFTPDNSSIPNQNIAFVCDSDNLFLIGIPDKEGRYKYIYYMEPDTGKIRRTDNRIYFTNKRQIKSNTDKNAESPVILQFYGKRNTFVDGKTLELLKRNVREFSRRNIKKGMMEVTVSSNQEDNLLIYRGFELSCVNDFTLWQGQLIFATGNGLYISKPYSNEIHCILIEPSFFFCLCPIGDRMYIGTSDGLYFVEAGRFLDIVKKEIPLDIVAPSRESESLDN